MSDPPVFAWDVFVPGSDLPRRITTDYLVSEGELLTVDGRPCLVERVEPPDPAADADAVSLVHVTAPQEPA